MAKFKTAQNVMIEIENSLRDLGESIEKELVPEMLDMGAKIVTEEWKNSINRHDHIDSNAMIDSVGAKKGKAKNLREIYPQGKDKKGVRNAEKAFIAHYGKSGQLGTRFVDEAEENSEAECIFEMQKKLDEAIEEKGL